MARGKRDVVDIAVSARIILTGRCARRGRGGRRITFPESVYRLHLREHVLASEYRIRDGVINLTSGFRNDEARLLSRR